MAVMIKIGSHRAAGKLRRILPNLQKYWSWTTHATGGFALVEEDMLEEVLKIKGITKAPKNHKYNECWN
jgi:hypothetical protein